MSGSESQAVLLWRLLESGAHVPKGTGHLVADGRLCALVAKRVGVAFSTAWDVFAGVPVKEVRAIVGWAMGAPEEERPRALRSWRRRRDERESLKKKGVA